MIHQVVTYTEECDISFGSGNCAKFSMFDHGHHLARSRSVRHWWYFCCVENIRVSLRDTFSCINFIFD